MDANGLTAARAARDAGIKKATDHAEEVSAGWGDLAFIALCDFIAVQGSKNFTSESFRASEHAKDLPSPPSLRAFGGTIRRAANAGLIVKVGITESKAAHCHCAHVAEWRAS